MLHSHARSWWLQIPPEVKSKDTEENPRYLESHGILPCDILVAIGRTVKFNSKNIHSNRLQ